MYKLCINDDRYSINTVQISIFLVGEWREERRKPISSSAWLFVNPSNAISKKFNKDLLATNFVPIER
jgi:hypothetical protein